MIYLFFSVSNIVECW